MDNNTIRNAGAEQAQRLEAALSPGRAMAVQIARHVAGRVGLSLDERFELADRGGQTFGAKRCA